MLSRIGIVMVVSMLVVGGLATTKPDVVTIERSATIRAAPEEVFALINNYHYWAQWSPWEKRDTALLRTFSGADSGVGAVYEWSGNSDVGSGRMEITESTEPSTVVMKLDFMSPMESHNLAEFHLTQGSNGTNVRWNMHAPADFLTKVMCVFVSMDQLVGPDFEEGLANLKAKAERQASDGP